MGKENGLRWRGLTLKLGAPSPFGETAEGKHDYRGAPVFEAETIDGLAICNCDFSNADLHHVRIANCSFEDCIFDNADLVEVTTRKSVFRNCRFRNTDFRISQLGYAWSVFDHCVFQGVRTNRIGLHNAIFEGIKFHGRDWNGVDFGASGFWNCSFEGNLRGVTFRGDYQFPMQRETNGEPIKTGLHSVNFAASELFWVGVDNGCVLDQIVLPASGSAFLTKTETLLSFERVLSFDRSHCVEKYFNTVRPYAAKQIDWIVSKNDFVYLCDELGEEIYRSFRDHCVDERGAGRP
jgi:fluoroquinolone resistance protein